MDTFTHLNAPSALDVGFLLETLPVNTCSYYHVAPRKLPSGCWGAQGQASGQPPWFPERTSKQMEPSPAQLSPGAPSSLAPWSWPRPGPTLTLWTLAGMSSWPHPWAVDCDHAGPGPGKPGQPSAGLPARASHPSLSRQPGFILFLVIFQEHKLPRFHLEFSLLGLARGRTRGSRRDREPRSSCGGLSGVPPGPAGQPGCPRAGVASAGLPTFGAGPGDLRRPLWL